VYIIFFFEEEEEEEEEAPPASSRGEAEIWVGSEKKFKNGLPCFLMCSIVNALYIL
jgi:hypothetical protein